jgi:AraC-like DNA-binding protein
MHAPVTQAEAVARTPLSAGEAARFFLAPRLGGFDCLRATYLSHAYAPHTHDTYVLGTIERGCEAWTLRGTRHYAGPGDLVFVNPHEVHDGSPHDGGYSYRTTYPPPEVLRGIAEAVCGRRVVADPYFPVARVRDPHGAGLLAAAHRAMETGTDPFAAEELFHRAYGVLLVRHAALAPAAVGLENGPVRRVRDLIETRHGEDLSLDLLAREAGLSIDHLIRAFRRAVGMTPHAFLIDARVRRAKDLLRRGETPAEVAAEVGFADQAHLTRVFKARVGIGPGGYRRAAGPAAPPLRD